MSSDETADPFEATRATGSGAKADPLAVTGAAPAGEATDPLAVTAPPLDKLGVSGSVERQRARAVVAERLLGKSLEAPKIGRYTVVRRLGAGGMAIVYAAYDDQLDRRVALKILRAESGSTRTRMLREAQALAKVSHPNIVPVFEVGEDKDHPYIAMEFIKGHNLREWRDAEDRSWRESVEKYVQAGRGLAAAHEAGLVHRDFKPDNAAIGDDGRVRVLDFGLVRAGDEDETAKDLEATELPAPEQEALSSPLTKTGAMMGTPAYMAPEQFLGDPTDARTDQFSFCVALWEALYGERPFAGDSMASQIASVTKGRIRTPPKDTVVPARIRRTLQTGMALSPGERWTSMEALLAELENDPSARLMRLAGLGLVGVVAIGTAWVWSSREAEHSTVQAELEAAKETEEQRANEAERGLRLREDSLLVEEAEALVRSDPARAIARLKQLPKDTEVSPDRVRLVASAAREFGIADFAYEPSAGRAIGGVADGKVLLLDQAKSEVLVVELETGRELRLGLGGGSGFAQAISRDGERVFRVDPEGAAWVHDLAQGGSRQLGEVGEGHRASEFAAAANRVVVDDRSSPTVWDLDSGEHWTLEPSDGSWMMRHQISADGRTLVIARRAGPRAPDGWTGRKQEGLWLWEVGDSAPKKLSAQVTWPAVSADGQFVADGADRFTAREDVSVRVWSRADGRWRTLSRGRRAERVQFAKDGSLVAVSGGRLDVWRRPEWRHAFVDPRGEDPRGKWVVGMRDQQISPDGRYLLSTSDWAGREWAAATIWDLRNGVDMALGGERILDYAFAADGSRLTASTMSGKVRQWKVPLAPTGAVLGEVRGAEDVHYLRGGDSLLLSDQDKRIVLWDLAAGKEIGVGNCQDNAPQVAASSVSNRIAGACATITPPHGKLSVWDLDTREQRVIWEGDAWVGRVAFARTRDLLVWTTMKEFPRGVVHVLDLASKEPKEVGEVDAMTRNAISPSGDRLAAVATEGGIRVWDTATGTVVMDLADPEAVARQSGLFGTLRQTLPTAALAFAPDGQSLALAEFRVIIYDLASGTPRTLGRHGDWVWDLAYSPDGKTLLSASHDNTVRVWDVATGHSRVIDLGVSVAAVAYSPDGLQFAAAGTGCDSEGPQRDDRPRSGCNMIRLFADDLPRDMTGLRAWMDRATGVEVELRPIGRARE